MQYKQLYEHPSFLTICSRALRRQLNDGTRHATSCGKPLTNLFPPGTMVGNARYRPHVSHVVFICTQYAASLWMFPMKVIKIHRLPTIYEDRIWFVDSHFSPLSSASSTNRNQRRKCERRALTHHERARIEYYERMARRDLFIFLSVSTAILLAGVLFALHGLPRPPRSRMSDKDMLAFVIEECLCTTLRGKGIVLRESEPARGIGMHRM